MDTILLFVAEWIGAVAVAMIAGMSLRFKRTRLVFKYPRREGIVALSVAGLVLLFAVVLALWVAPFSLAGLPLALSSRLYLAAAGTVPVVVALWRRKQPVRSMGWGREKLMAGLQLGLALAFLTIFLRGRFNSVINGLNSVELTMLAYSAGIAALEETVFRGYIQPRIASWWGDTGGWLAAAALFVICQVPRLLASPEMLAMNLLIITGQSLVAGYIMLRSGHTLAPALYRAISDWMLYVQ